MLLGKFRDDIREAHGKERLLPPERGSQHLPLAELTLSELEAAGYSAGTLLDQFGALMDDPELPELLRDFRDTLSAEKADRPETQRAGTPLTERELSILRLVADGLTNKQIADELFVSIRTVQTHLVNVYAKTGAKNRVQAMNWLLGSVQ